MSGFIQDTINQATTSTKILGGVINSNNNNNENNGQIVDSKSLLSDLISIVKECQTRYGGKTELATENDLRILKLCNVWEQALSHGLIKGNSTFLKNVTDIIQGQPLDAPTFWDFAYQHLTTHEKERFSTLRYVWTDRGKARALIRAALNERAMERYILVWLNDLNLPNSYEKWAFIRDIEVVNLLPSIASGLSSILFAVSVDSTDLNVNSTMNLNDAMRPEPVIASPAPNSSQTRKLTTAKRQIISFDDNNNRRNNNDHLSQSSTSPSQSICGSAPKSLSSLCLKIDENVTKTTSKLSHLNNDNVIRPSIADGIDNITTTFDNNANVYERKPSVELPNTNNYFNSIVETPPQSDSDIIEIYGTVEDQDDRSNNNNNDNNRSSISSSSSTSSTTTTTSSSSSAELHANSFNTEQEDINILRLKLRDAEERCNLLEARLIELNRENHRLRNLNNASRHNPYFMVSVPRVILQRTNARKYYAYEIHIIPTNGGGSEEWTVLRRYNEFYKLHKRLQKDHVAVKTLDFPPKKKFGNMDANFVEQRRQRLQVYLRHLISLLPDVTSCTTRTQLEQTFAFLK